MESDFIEQFNSIQAYIENTPLLFFALLAWTIYWKGMALWKAARRNHQKWFIAILIFNTVGILDILYLYVFSERMNKKPEAGKEGERSPNDGFNKG